jgi:hypothetical protein
MKKIIIAILIAVLFQLAFMPVLPVNADEGSSPPANPEESWLPPESGEVIEPPVDVQIYNESSSGIQTAPFPSGYPVTTGKIASAYLVDSYGRPLTSLYRNETCYLIINFTGPGYFYLWEYYPAGAYSYGHWLCYRWYRPISGVWRIGPFAAQPGDTAGRYVWKMWYLSGSSWSTRSLSFTLNEIYYPPDIPIPVPEPVYYPVIDSFTTTKSTLEAGETAVLTWKASNARSVTLSPDIGTVGASGSTSVTPASTTTYTLTAESKSGKTTSSDLTIAVNPRIAPEIDISPSKIQKGKTASLSWYAPGAVSVVISGIGETGVQGSMELSPQQTTTYILTVTYIDGSTESVQVTVEVEYLPWWVWVLIGLLLVVVVLAALFLVRKWNRKRRAAATGTATQYRTQDDTTQVDTIEAGTALPETTPLVAVPLSGLIMPDGNQIILGGNNRLMGRKDFEDYMPFEDKTYISRHHIDIWQEDGKYYIEDRSSTNGTKVNGMEIRGAGRYGLFDGDVIELATKLSIIFREDINKEVQ